MLSSKALNSFPKISNVRRARKSLKYWKPGTTQRKCFNTDLLGLVVVAFKAIRPKFVLKTLRSISAIFFESMRLLVKQKSSLTLNSWPANQNSFSAVLASLIHSELKPNEDSVSHPKSFKHTICLFVINALASIRILQPERQLLFRDSKLSRKARLDLYKKWWIEKGGRIDSRRTRWRHIWLTIPSNSLTRLSLSNSTFIKCIYSSLSWRRTLTSVSESRRFSFWRAILRGKSFAWSTSNASRSFCWWILWVIRCLDSRKYGNNHKHPQYCNPQGARVDR